MTYDGAGHDAGVVLGWTARSRRFWPSTCRRSVGWCAHDAFDAYWDAVDAELAACRWPPELREIPVRATHGQHALPGAPHQHRTVSRLRLLQRAEAAGPIPGLLLTPRYGSVNHVPDYHDRERYAVLQMHPSRPATGGQAVRGGVSGVADARHRRPGDVHLSRHRGRLPARLRVPAVAVGWIGDIGDPGRRPGADHRGAAARRVAVLADGLAAVPACWMRRRASDAYPAEEINDYLRALTRPTDGAWPRRWRTSIRARTRRRVRATTMLPSADDEWLAPLRAALGAQCQHYRLTHRGTGRPR